jgi:hypothetical protein
MGFELTISAFERAKTVYALDHAASVLIRLCKLHYRFGAE